MNAMTHEWRWLVRRPDRKGSQCRVLARGKLNSCLIEFADGERVITSRYAIRKLPALPTAAHELTNLRARRSSIAHLARITSGTKHEKPLCRATPFADYITRFPLNATSGLARCPQCRALAANYTTTPDRAQ